VRQGRRERNAIQSKCVMYSEKKLKIFFWQLLNYDDDFSISILCRCSTFAALYIPFSSILAILSYHDCRRRPTFCCCHFSKGTKKERTKRNEILKSCIFFKGNMIYLMYFCSCFFHFYFIYLTIYLMSVKQNSVEAAVDCDFSAKNFFSVCILFESWMVY